MSDPKTGRLPAISEWKTWLALIALFVLPPGAGTAVLTVKLDSLQTAVAKNTDASEANTKAVNDIKVAMQAGAVTDTRLLAVEKKTDDHETRIRVLEKGN